MTTITNAIQPRAVAAALALSCVAALTATAQADHMSVESPHPYVLSLHANGAPAVSQFMSVSAAGQRPFIVTLRDDGTTEMIGGAADPAAPQTKDDLMEGLDRIGAHAKERNEVNLDKNMMALAGNHGGRYGDLGNKIDLMTVRNYEFAHKDEYRKADLDALRHKLEGNGWSHLVRNEDENETNDIVVKTNGDGYISDMVILNAEPREVNVVHLRGHFRMDDVNGAMGRVMGMGAGAFGIAGAMGHIGSGSSSSSSSSSSAHSAPAPPAPPSPPEPPSPVSSRR